MGIQKKYLQAFTLPTSAVDSFTLNTNAAGTVNLATAPTTGVRFVLFQVYNNSADALDVDFSYSGVTFSNTGVAQGNTASPYYAALAVLPGDPAVTATYASVGTVDAQAVVWSLDVEASSRVGVISVASNGTTPVKLVDAAPPGYYRQIFALSPVVPNFPQPQIIGLNGDTVSHNMTLSLSPDDGVTLTAITTSNVNAGQLQGNQLPSLTDRSLWLTLGEAHTTSPVIYKGMWQDVLL